MRNSTAFAPCSAILLLTMLLATISNNAFSQFIKVSDGLVGLREGGATFTDFDADGDLDILIFGNDIEGIGHTLFFRNENLVFTEFKYETFPNLFDGSIDWADYNNDGKMDLALIGWSSSHNGLITKVLEYSTTFRDTELIFEGITRGSIDWGDFNNDGFPDLLVVGQDANSQSQTWIFENRGDTFTKVELQNVTGVSFGQAKWVDYDGDGYLDFFITGVTGEAPYTGDPVSHLYRNLGDNQGFELVHEHSFKGVRSSSVDWGDADGDGDLDLLLTGFTADHQPFTGLYINETDGFTLKKTSLPAIIEGFAKWGDMDRDGDLDIVIAGNTVFEGKIFKIYRNDATGFVEIFEGEGVGQCTGGWGDFNGDGFLDVFINGQNDEFDLIAAIYINNQHSEENERKLANPVSPTAPTNLTAEVNGNNIKLLWDKSPDESSSQSAITYNVKIEKGEELIISPMSLSTGERLLVEAGNAGSQNFFVSNKLKPGQYTWSVQVINTSYQASDFSTQGTFEIPENENEGEITGFRPEEIASLSFYPNPTKSVVHTTLESPTEFVIINMMGQICKKGLIVEQKIDITELKAGMYILKLTSGTKSISRKLVKE